MTESQVYEANRGCWRLGPQAQDERYAIFSYDGIVRQALEISSIEPAPKRSMRSVVYGRVLTAGHPIHDRFVGQHAPESLGRNPISYLPDEAPAEQTLNARFSGVTESRAVEIIAMSFVCGQYAVDGWIVEDVSALGLGWDITATKGPRVRHIEVKGVSGPIPKVLITQAELQAAGHDLDWVLSVVTNALTSPSAREYHPGDIRKFAVPLAYEADLRGA